MFDYAALVKSRWFNQAMSLLLIVSLLQEMLSNVPPSMPVVTNRSWIKMLIPHGSSSF